MLSPKFRQVTPWQVEEAHAQSLGLSSQALDMLGKMGYAHCAPRTCSLRPPDIYRQVQLSFPPAVCTIHPLLSKADNLQHIRVRDLLAGLHVESDNRSLQPSSTIGSFRRTELPDMRFRNRDNRW